MQNIFNITSGGYDAFQSEAFQDNAFQNQATNPSKPHNKIKHNTHGWNTKRGCETHQLNNPNQNIQTVNPKNIHHPQRWKQPQPTSHIGTIQQKRTKIISLK